MSFLLGDVSLPVLSTGGVIRYGRFTDVGAAIPRRAKSM
jgi:hypothetical protein